MCSDHASFNVCTNFATKIIQKLEVSLDERMSYITKYDLFLKIADVLNTHAGILVQNR
jgi:hypothetical protein